MKDTKNVISFHKSFLRTIILNININLQLRTNSSLEF